MKVGKIKSVALHLTHNCNLRCNYCYAGEKFQKSMSFETAKKSIDFIVENSNGSCVINFFGGEPLLKIELIKKIIQYSSSNKKLDFRLSTNGTLLNDKLIKFLHKNEITFVLSLDGNEKQHDFNRRYKNGKATYNDILINIKSILQHNPYTLVTSVTTPATIYYLSAGIESLYKLGFRYIIQTLDFTANWETNHLKILKHQYGKVAEFYYSELIKGSKIYISAIDERIKTRAQKPYCKGELCDLANSMISIAPSGRIYPCVQFVGTDNEENQKKCIGDIFSGFNVDKRMSIIEENHHDIESCKNCALLGRCATYCGCLNWKSTGFLNIIPPILCEYERMLMPIVDKLANKFWSKNNTRIINIQIGRLPLLPRGRITYKVVPPKMMQGMGRIPMSILFLVDG